jgi:membrane-associated phospholipid phosphatase
MTMAGWGIARRLSTIDVLTMAFVAQLAAGTIARAAQIPGWRTVVIICAIVAGGVPFLGWLRTHLDLGAVRVVHDWSLALSVYPIYLAVMLVAGPSHSGRVYDAWLIAADRWIFGTDPTVWLARFAHPIVTELLQLSYALFYLLPLAVGAELYLGGRESRFRRWVFVCGCGFFVSYAGYLVLPAVGPRFALHDPGALARELPGLWLTPSLRALIDGGGMAPVGATAGEAMRLAPRDAFPSGHALVTILAIFWAWRQRLGARWAVTVAGTLLVVSTLYLRYHYVVDVLAGVALAALCLSLAPIVHAWLAGQLGTIDDERKAR